MPRHRTCRRTTHDHLIDCLARTARSPCQIHTHLQQVAAVNWLTREV